MSFLINSINDCRWNLLDKVSQKATSISRPLGTFGNSMLHLLPGIAAQTYFFPVRSHPIFRVIYMITSIIALVLFNKIQETSKKHWVKKQIKEICLKSKTEKKIRKLLYIASSFSDPWNLQPSIFFDFRTKSDVACLARNFEVNFIEASSHHQLQQKISKLKDQDLDAVIIQAHGCSSDIMFSRDYAVDLDSLGIFETLAKKLKPHANVSLMSCSTGKGVDNIAQRISNLCSEVTIFSPIANYKVNDYDSFKIADDGSCSFKSGNFIDGLFEGRRNITRIYRKGIATETA